jgi:LemA protein
MGLTAIIVVVAILLAVLILVWIYNRLVRYRNLVEESWSGIDVQLTRRHDLIPNLIKVAERYRVHEAELLKEVTEARAESMNATGAAQKSVAEDKLGGALARFFAVAENYPDLKAAETYTNLHHELAEIENALQMARRYYNGTVRDYNTFQQSIPAAFFAGMFGFTPAEYFEIQDPKVREVPQVPEALP